MSKPKFELKLVNKLPTTDINQDFCYSLTAVDGAKSIDTIWRYYSSAWHQVGTDGYTTENVTNKVSVLTDATSTTKYTTVKAVVDGLAGKEDASNKKTDLTTNTDVVYPSVKAVNTGLGLKMDKMSSITGYNASATQTLKNVTGTLTWVTDL